MIKQLDLANTSQKHKIHKQIAINKLIYRNKNKHPCKYTKKFKH